MFIVLFLFIFDQMHDSDSFDGIEEYDGSGWDFLKRMAEGGEYEYDEDDDEEYDEDDDEDDEDGDGEEFDDEYDMGGSEFDPRLVYEDDDDDDEEDEEDGSEFDEELEYDSDGVPRLIPAVNQPLKRKIKIVELKVDDPPLPSISVPLSLAPFLHSTASVP